MVILRLSILIVGVILSFQSFSQDEDWKDSLRVARQAYKNQEYPKALKYYQSAQRKAPKDVDLSDEIGQSAYKSREFEQAEKIYQQNASSKKTKEDKAKSYHNMGNSRMQKKDYAGAIDSYKEALRNNPNDTETRYNLSEAIRRLKDEQKKNCQNPNQQNNSNCQNPNQKQQNQGQDQQNQQNNQSQQNQGQQHKSSNQEKGSGSKLPNKSVDRMLDNLMKAETETKRKMSGSRTNSSSSNSGKDW